MVNTEFIAYSVTRLRCLKKDGTRSSGTGFFFAIHVNQTTHVPILVTNKHVIKNSVETEFKLTSSDNKGKPIFNGFPSVKLPTKNLWIDHPDPNIDLCATTFGNIANVFENQLGSKLLWRTIRQDLIPTEEELNTLTEMEDVVMVGYPIGLADEQNNRPIFRKGVTATKPSLQNNGRKEFLIDIAAFPGSSGSPVFLYKEGLSITNSIGTNIAERKNKFFFIGVLWGGPVLNATGKIVSKPIPTTMDSIVKSEIPTNLGFVINSYVLREFEKVITTKSK